MIMVNYVYIYKLLSKDENIIFIKDTLPFYNLYKQQKARVKINELADPADINKGTKQKCLLSPYLFNIYLELIVNKALSNTNCGIINGSLRLKVIKFSDYLAMIVESAKALNKMVQQLNQTSRESGMEININKTKIMSISRKSRALSA